MSYDRWGRIEENLGAEETAAIRERIRKADEQRQAEAQARLAAERAEQETPEALAQKRQAHLRHLKQQF